MSKIQKNAMLEALEKSLGIVTTACKKVGIHRSTHYDWMNTDQEYAQGVRDIENIALDFAESKLHQQIEENNTAATIFFLKCRGKSRGYTERIDIGSDENSIKLEIIDGRIKD